MRCYVQWRLIRLRKITRHSAASFFAMVTASCAATYQTTYAPSADNPTAMVHFVAKRDAAGFLPTGYTFRFSQGPNCGADGLKASLGGKFKTSAIEDFKPVPIPADTSINLAATTIRTLNNAIRQCGDIIKFTPIAGHTYDAIFESTDAAQNCALSVKDATTGAAVGEALPNCYVFAPDGIPVKNGHGHTQLGPKIEVHVTHY